MAKSIASSNSKPGSWIVSPTDKGRKSIKNGKVFLNNEELFDIELFNPLTVSVLADIKLNGQSISKTGLVVKPGQRVYLDCFIDDKKKFKFSTYEIESSLESLNATQNNGLLEVFFYKEDVITINNWKTRFDKIIIERYPVYYPIYPQPYPYRPYEVWYTNTPVYGGVYGGTLNNTGGVGGTITTSSGTGIVGTTTTNAYYSSSNTSKLNNVASTYTSQVDLSSLNVGGSLSSNSMPINSSIETGRVEKGSSSSQKFTEVDMDFENHYIASTIIQILPESRKPAEIKQVKGGLNSVKAKDILKRESEDVIELIKKLADLHSAGILTDEEFSNKKAELLSKI